MNTTITKLNISDTVDLLVNLNQICLPLQDIQMDISSLPQLFCKDARTNLSSPSSSSYCSSPESGLVVAKRTNILSDIPES
jgi:hypothetical protein